MTRLNEDTLVQQTTAEYLKNQLGWDSFYAYNQEKFGPNGILGHNSLGRDSDSEIILKQYLLKALVELNPGLPDIVYQDAVKIISSSSITQTPMQINKEKYELFKNGVPVQFRTSKGVLEQKRLKIFNFEEYEKNHFLAVRELWIKGNPYRRRADIVCFVNGIPLIFMELKTVYKDIRAAYEQNLSDYKDTVPHLFHHNALVILSNGHDARIGSFSSKFEYFHEWKRLAEEDKGYTKDDEYEIKAKIILEGLCNKNNLMDYFENFILFDDSSGQLIKITAKNHQFLGVNKAIKAVNEAEKREGKLGVFWHTQGSGKSYSMVFYTKKIHRKIAGDYTFVICTDREDLDRQIYNTYAGCGLVDNDRNPCRSRDGNHLEELLREQKSYIFTLIQKFNKEVDPNNPYSDRDNIIVISDEAHRSQYHTLALNRQNALKNASYIGFTGTPLFKDDEITRRIFGDYISTYDFQRAVDDNATVPLYYEPRGDRLGIATNDLNEKIAQKLEELEIEDIDVAQRLEQALKGDYHIITANERLKQMAKDFVDHYSIQYEDGKAMIICIDKITCVRVFKFIQDFWDEKIKQLEKDLKKLTDEQEALFTQRRIKWMKETRMAVVISEEQGEVDKFKKWDLDIVPHRKLIKDGYETDDGKRIDIESAFKKEEHPFRVAIVCAMWLTGFDVPCLTNLYLDKPLKAHTLMQAIARANRVHEEKSNGLIVDYCGILRNLRTALATFAGHSGTGGIDPNNPPPEVDPARPADEELIANLVEAICLLKAFLKKDDFTLDDITNTSGFERNAALVKAKEIANVNDETRKHFEIMAREVFNKYKACLTINEVNNYRKEHEAIKYIYDSLQEDVHKADISDIIKELHTIVDESVVTREVSVTEDTTVYDISKIDFEKLRKEFEKSPRKNSTVQSLKTVIENRLRIMLQQNPLRTDFQQHYEEIIAEYNREKDRVVIEKTFADLLNFVKNLDEESERAMREGLDEESLSFYDMLIKPDISKKEIQKLKEVAIGLLKILKAEKEKIFNWKEKETTRDTVKTIIHNYLFDGNTGLPDSYTKKEIKEKTEAIYSYLYYNQAA